MTNNQMIHKLNKWTKEFIIVGWWLHYQHDRFRVSIQYSFGDNSGYIMSSTTMHGALKKATTKVQKELKELPQ